jgi:hypothetical protein
MSYKRLCNKQMEIHPRVETRGSQGAAAFSWDAARSVRPKVMARIAASSAFERNIAKQDGYTISHKLHFVDDPQLHYQDQLWFQGRKFIIQGVPKNADEMNRIWSCDALEVEQRQV